MKLRQGLLIGIVGLVAAAPVAAAHSGLEKARPKAGSRLAAPPDHLILTFDDPLTRNSVVHVYDGCRRFVVENFAVDGRSLHVFLQPGDPGRWLVHYVAVSKKDGHPEPGKFGLKVAGRTACDGKPAAAASPPADDEAGTSGLLLIGIAVAVVAGLAVAVRIALSR